MVASHLELPKRTRYNRCSLGSNSRTPGFSRPPPSYRMAQHPVCPIEPGRPAQCRSSRSSCYGVSVTCFIFIVVSLLSILFFSFHLWSTFPLQSSKIQRVASVYKCALILFIVKTNNSNNLIFKCQGPPLTDLKGLFKGADTTGSAFQRTTFFFFHSPRRLFIYVLHL